MSTAILGATEQDLRRDRTSVKWLAYPPDVLPLWVAEMDAAPCPAVVEAVSAAMARGDTGYGWAPRYAAEVTRYASDMWDWSFDPADAVVVADVMIGVSEMLRVLTDEGGPVIVSPPVYDSFFGFVEAIGRRRVDAPLGPDGRLDLAAPRDHVPGRDGVRATSRVPPVQPPEPHRDGAHRRGARRLGGPRGRARRPGRQRRDPRAARVPGRARLHAVPVGARR